MEDQHQIKQSHQTQLMRMKTFTELWLKMKEKIKYTILYML